MNLALAIDLPSRRPLLTVEAAVTLLDRDPIEVAAAVDAGVLAWAWDLAGAQAKRRELRLWRGSVERCRQTGGVDGGGQIAEAQVLADILPARDLRASEVWRRLGISRQRLAEMIATGELQVAQAARCRQGVNATEIITRASLVALLRKRRVA